MKFPLSEILAIGLPLAAGFVGGPAAAAVPTVVNKRNRRLGYRDDPERGHDYAAVGLKQIFEATFPDETVDQVNRIVLTWATLLIQEAEQAEKDEKAARKQVEQEAKKARKQKRRKIRPGSRRGRR